MHLRTDNKPAPGDLAVIHGLLNTRADELNIEELDSPQSTAQWLRMCGLWPHRRLPSEQEVVQLTAFRELLRQFVLSPNAASAENINRMLDSTPISVHFFETGSPRIQGSAEGMSGVIGTLAGIVVRSSADGTWSRFKCCQLPTCGWAFYDYSRNRSGRWCSMKTCGSRHKARAYLARKASSSKQR